MKTCLQKKTIATSLQKACKYYMKMWQLIKSTCKHTILFIASANKGGLCLVAKHISPLDKNYFTIYIRIFLQMC